MLNNALILDDSTEVVVVSNANFKNNNEKLPARGQQVSQTHYSKSSTDQEFCDSASKKSSSSSRNYSSNSSGDNSWMEKDPFEVSYSGSINYNSISKQGTK